MRPVAPYLPNGARLALFLGRCSVNDSLGLARPLLSEGFEPLGVVRADFSSCPFLTSVVLASEEVQLEREGTDSSSSLCSSGESCKPSVPKAMEGSRIGAGGRTARYRIFPVVAWCPAGTGLMWDPVPLQC